PGKTEKEKGAGRILESWARCVEITLTKDRYNKRVGFPNYEYWASDTINHTIGNYQNYKTDTIDFYTPALFDLIDSFNQRAHYGNDYPQDDVDCFTIKEVQDIVQYSD